MPKIQALKTNSENLLPKSKKPMTFLRLESTALNQYSLISDLRIVEIMSRARIMVMILKNTLRGLRMIKKNLKHLGWRDKNNSRLMKGTQHLKMIKYKMW